MKHFNPQPEIKARVLATDLDGTLIPLPERPQNKDDLIQIRELHDAGKQELVFATGRHFESVMEAVEEYGLPRPEWLICDVGSRIFRMEESGYAQFAPYEAHLSELVGKADRPAVEALLADLDGLDFQQPSHQTEHKISYQCTADRVEDLSHQVRAKLEAAALPYSCMGSLDPFLNIGLIDVLPGSVSKAYALIWLSTHADFVPDEVVYAGDSGNDEAALSCGFRAIVVANGSTGLAERVQATLASRSLIERFYQAKGEATSGVLEGMQHFGLVE